MKKITTLALTVAAAALTACGGGGGGGAGDTPPVPEVPTAPSTGLQTSVPTPTYTTSSAEARVFDVMNSERGRCGFGKVVQNTKLDVAATAHAGYLKLRFNEGLLTGHDEDPSKTGYYATTGADRATKAGYAGVSPGDYLSYYNLGTTADYGNALVRAMMATVYHQIGMLDGNRDVGVAVSFADDAPAGYKLAALVWQPGTATGAAQQETANVVTYPCEGSTGVQPYMFGENPDPFASLGFAAGTNIGHPIYVRAPSGKAVVLSQATLTSAAGKVVPVTLYHKRDDANGRLTVSQAFVIPREPLEQNTSYTVDVRGTVDGVAIAPTVGVFSFTTLKF